jgi:TP901 family phage tail tape measure protein
MRVGVLFRAVDQFTGPLQRMVRSAQSLRGVANVARDVQQSVGERMAQAGQSFLAFEAARRSLAALAEPAVRVEDALAAAQTVWAPAAGGMQESLVELRTAARDWSAAHVASTEDFIRAAYEMGSAGLNSRQAIEGTRAALGLATATFGDNRDAANLLAVTYNTLGNKVAAPAEEFERISNVLAKTQALFQIANLQQLGEGLKYAIPAAKATGQQLEEVAASVGLLNTLGLQGSMAGTAYAQFLQKLEASGSKLNIHWARTASGSVDVMWALDRIRAKYGDLQRATVTNKELLRSAFGDEGFRALVLLSGATDQYRTSLAGVRSAAGTVAQALGAIESTTSSQWKILSNRIENLREGMARRLLPVLERVGHWAKEAVAAMQRWADANPAIASVLGGLGALVAVTTALGAVTNLVRVAFSFAFGGWVKAAVLGLWSAMTWLLASLGAAATALWSALVPAFSALVVGVKAAGTALLVMARSAVLAGMAFLATPVGWLTAALVALGSALAYVASNWNELTAQSNTFAEISPQLASRIREDAAFRSRELRDALGGNVQKQQMLSAAMGDVFTAEFWTNANRQRAQQTQTAELRAAGLDAGPLATPQSAGPVAPDAAMIQLNGLLGLVERDTAGSSMPALPGLPTPESLGAPVLPPPLPGAPAGTASPDTRQPNQRTIGTLNLSVTVNEAQDEERLVNAVLRRFEEALAMGAA